MKNGRFQLAATLLVLALRLPDNLWAQAIITATLSGTVSDPAGGVVPQAFVSPRRVRRGVHDFLGLGLEDVDVHRDERPMRLLAQHRTAWRVRLRASLHRSDRFVFDRRRYADGFERESAR